jgi:5,5'-dehydrodivanillate O-demethylase
MLTVKENERFTRVGPGTPGGALLRRYWHVAATSQEMRESPTKAVRLLGEDLVLYKDRSGTLGLIQESCPHRRVNLLYGIPEQHGLRCPYHGWLFDETGRCLEMPAEAPDSTFKDRVTALTYPVQELGGLVWAYLGPAPAPLLPRWDFLVRDNLVRNVGLTVVPCNWLQCMENSMDPVHTEWLHAYLMSYVMDRRGETVPKDDQGRYIVQRHTRIGFDRFEHGIYKRRLLEGQSEDHDDWQSGHPVIFPNILKTTGSPGLEGTLQIRVPMDDTHTWHLMYRCAAAEPDAPRQEEVPSYDLPLLDEQGRYRLDVLLVQDFMAWSTQGGIADRSVEKLGESDRGIILYRRLLKQQMDIVADGGEPMNVFRDPAQNAIIEISAERKQYQLLPWSGEGLPAVGGRSA